MTNIWRYEYGLPYDRLPQNTVILGTNTYFPVHELYLVLRIADKRVTRGQLISLLERPSERSKHDDVLFEMQPLKDVGMEIHAEYEVAGLGIGYYMLLENRSPACEHRIRLPRIALKALSTI